MTYFHRVLCGGGLACASLLAVMVPTVRSDQRPALDATTATPNDNRRAAGTLTNGVLTVTLEARESTWYPEGPNSRGLSVAAWAEEGQPPSVPGPLIRVPTGTHVRATLRNTFAEPLTVFGFGAKRGMADSVVIPAGDSRLVQFRANASGTFYYLARRRVVPPFGGRHESDMPLGGAIVIDTVGAPRRANDRVLVLSWWVRVDPTRPTGVESGTMTINGLAWPHTERIDLTQGDSVRWRVVNLTELDHPMHLHGFYFRLTSKGDGVHDSLFTRDQQRLGVTEMVQPFTSISLAWLPDRPGNWIYHCHFADHLAATSSLDGGHAGHGGASTSAHGSGTTSHEMFGLVLGLRVAPKGRQVTSSVPPRAIRMTVRQKEGMYGAHAGYAMVLGGTDAERDPDAMPIPGAPLVLERGKLVAITVVNRAKEPASIHWHGVELESFPDGVPGWSGSGNNILPAIAPGDSITVRYTPPRTGTFMYHSHFNESAQISAGLYGPIIVVDPGQPFNAEHERLLFFGTSGPFSNVVFGPFPNHTMNGAEQPPPMDLRAGQTYRFRLFNLAEGGPVMVSLMHGSNPVEWRAVAKDGAALPVSQRVMRPATLLFEPGEIYDFEFTPAAAGDLTLTFGPPPIPPNVTLPPELKIPPVRSVLVRVSR